MTPGRLAVQVGAALLILGALFGTAYVQGVQNAFHPFLFADDARQQIVPFLNIESSTPVAAYTPQYYQKVFIPAGVRFLYETLAGFSDPAFASVVVSYFLFFIFCSLMGASAYRLSGTGFATLILALSSDLFLERMMGGLPRSFAYPILAGALAALVYGRAGWLVVLTILGFAFYPVAGVVCGLTYALWSLLSLKDVESGIRIRKILNRIRWLGAILFVSLAMTFPQLIASGDYGSRITQAMWNEFPEAGEGGRYGANDRPPYPGLIATLQDMGVATLDGSGYAPVPFLSLKDNESYSTILTVFVWLAFAVIAVGGVFALVRKTHTSYLRGLILLPASLLGYFLALVFDPYLFLPERYLLYTIPVLLIVLAPSAIVLLLQDRMRDKSFVLHASSFAPVFALWLAVGGTGNNMAGLTVRAEAWKPFYEALENLPKGSLIAGWPGGLVENVPYLSRRPILISYETHQVFHSEYALEMRRRMNALITAYWAQSASALRELRDDYDVDYLIVDLQHFSSNPPGYFKPFDATIEAALTRNENRPFYIERRYSEMALFQMGTQTLLDLHKLPTE
ncbi:MAG: hypothetical protein G3M78_10500 [Candidatus Nitrohelix vancouverensis]|uniref:Glycosyltransferase RgtA/B/C/D-like domain-containing protein n=1 Tax=Candidatus Nitrohelix vancouverensis TaxID=2705534 RepID=A0A7T0C3C7_9BACT|nr:MAG: hypothetical protein G3M78_10500 [Candidatus Nitrohelix vancouverensis]